MDLENEVEILYFPKGSVLVKEGERNAGLYFVIEGFLDVSMPEAESTLSAKGRTAEQRQDDADKAKAKAAAGPKKGTTTTSQPMGGGGKSSSSTVRTKGGVGATGPTTTRKPAAPTSAAPPPPPPKAKSIPLFTVRPGGIAGYLSSLSGFPSYVDIVAKTECYVGFLPAKALERIMDRKPIVLLTLAKRLISLLSPLGALPSTLERRTALTRQSSQSSTLTVRSTGCTSARVRSSTARTKTPTRSTSCVALPFLTRNVTAAHSVPYCRSSTGVCAPSSTVRTAVSRSKPSMARASRSESSTASRRRRVRPPCTPSVTPSSPACP